MDSKQLAIELSRPFHPSHVTFKPGATKGDRALALAYADLRAYMVRLDEALGLGGWSVSYEPWGEGRIIATVGIRSDDAGWTFKSSTGETSNESERQEIGGTVAEAQAFKRACAMFGLGRYLYELPQVWADFDPNNKRFTEQGLAKLRGMVVQHYVKHAEQPEQVDLSDFDPSQVDEVPFGEEDDFAQADLQQQPKLYTQAAVMRLMGTLLEEGGGDASEAQVRLLIRRIGEAGAADPTAALNQWVQGRPVPKRMATKLLNKLSKTTKDKESDTYVPNGEYDVDFVHSIGRWWG